MAGSRPHAVSMVIKLSSPCVTKKELAMILGRYEREEKSRESPGVKFTLMVLIKSIGWKKKCRG